MTKQVESAPVTNVAAPVNGNTPQNLFVSVKTFSGLDGKTIGERIVDMCHYGTRNWLSNHLWWATHNGHCTEINLASPEEIDGYLEQGKLALAAKFNVEAPAEPVVAAS